MEQAGISDGELIAFAQADAAGRGLLLSRKMAAAVSEDGPAQEAW